MQVIRIDGKFILWESCVSFKIINPGLNSCGSAMHHSSETVSKQMETAVISLFRYVCLGVLEDFLFYFQDLF